MRLRGCEKARPAKGWRCLPWLALLSLVAILGGSLAPPRAAAAPEETDPLAPLAKLGFRVTGGAAPGYVDDPLCAMCHDEARSYSEVAMSQAFFRPSAGTAIEDFDSGYFHVPSQRHYRMVRKGDSYLFRRFQIDPAGEEINALEQPVDWILGSGKHTRSYLYRTEAGELYQLPIAWYSQVGAGQDGAGQDGAWRMAPGYDRADHEGTRRQVRRECMFCHNAYPDVAAGSDAYREPHLFPRELPQGIGCQRCHGPGALHVALALTPGSPRETLRGAVVNPGRLEPRLQNGICYGCHFLPAVTVLGVRRFGRADYSFRPGEPLEDYLVSVDIEEASRQSGERFEINHHPYRLEQSECFIRSADALSCLTCHDPHRNVPPADRAEHYRSACLGCHAVEDLAETSLGEDAATHAAENLDCVPCHMPQRRTQDVVHVTMTDHRIQVWPPGVDLTAALAEDHDPQITDVKLLPPDHAPSGTDGSIYRAATVARLGGVSRDAVERLDQLLHSDAPAAARDAPDPWFDLVAGLLRQQRPDRLARALEGLEARAPDSALVAHWKGLAHQARGELDEAIEDARKAIELEPVRAEAHYNLGLYLVASGRMEEATAPLREAITLRPNPLAAWFYLGWVQRRLGRLDEASVSLRRALELEPSHSRAYLDLAEALRGMGEEAEAKRYLEHGLRVAADADPIRQALAELGEESRGRP